MHQYIIMSAFAQNTPQKRQKLDFSLPPHPTKHPVDVKRGTLEYVDGP